VNLSASRTATPRELTFKGSEPDYTLFVDSTAIGTIEAKPAVHSLTIVEEQSEKYVESVPFGMPPGGYSSHFHRRCLSHGGHGRQAAQLGLHDFPGLVTNRLWKAQITVR
jgi:hypothetical protein